MSTKGPNKEEAKDKQDMEAPPEMGAPPPPPPQMGFGAPPPPPPPGGLMGMPMTKPLDLADSSFAAAKNEISLKAQAYKELASEGDSEQKALTEKQLKEEKKNFEKTFVAPIDEIAELIEPTLAPNAKVHLRDVIAELYKGCDNPAVIQELEADPVNITRILEEGSLNFEALKILARLAGSEITRLESEIKDGDVKQRLDQKISQLATLRKTTQASLAGNEALLKNADQLPPHFVKQVEANIESTTASFKEASSELQADIDLLENQLQGYQERLDRLKKVHKVVFNKAKAPFLEVQKAYPSFKKAAKKQEQALTKTVDLADENLKQLLSAGIYYQNLLNFIILDDEDPLDFNLDRILYEFKVMIEKWKIPIDETTFAAIASGYLTRKPGTCNKMKPLEGAYFDESCEVVRDILLQQLYEAMPKLKEEALAIARAKAQATDSQEVSDTDLLLKQGNVAVMANVNKANGGHAQTVSSANVNVSGGNAPKSGLGGSSSKPSSQSITDVGKKPSAPEKKKGGKVSVNVGQDDEEDFRAVNLKSTSKGSKGKTEAHANTAEDRNARLKKWMKEVQAERDAALKEMASAGNEAQFGKRGAQKLKQCENELRDIQALSTDKVVSLQAQLEIDKLQGLYTELELRAAKLEQENLALQEQLEAQQEQMREEKKRIAEKEVELTAKEEQLAHREAKIPQQSPGELVRSGNLEMAFKRYKEETGHLPSKREATQLISQNVQGNRARQPLMKEMPTTLAKLKKHK